MRTAGILTWLLIAASATLGAGAAWGAQKADEVMVDKSERRLYLLKDGDVLRSYPVTFGDDPQGHKVREGDGRTPEGRYTLGYKNANSSYYKSIHITYPNAEDRDRARAQGVDPGGDIMVHGQPNHWGWAGPILQLLNWTDGCVALRNGHMDEVWDSVDPGTPIEIRP